MKNLPLSLLFAGFVALPLCAQIGSSPSGAPAENWEMKIFTREGFRSMILRGSEVRLTAADRYDVIDLNITIFSGGADAHIEHILLSPSASFFVKENRASGDKTVRLIRDDMEVTGEQWSYVRAAQKVTIQKKARVVFHAALPDLIQ